MARLTLTFLCLSLFAVNCFAGTLYVSDRLTINMRSGKSNNHRIIASLRSGTAVSVISEDATAGYTEVKANGKVGWVLSRQLDPQPSARNSLIMVQNSMEALQKQLDDITTQYEKVSTEYETASQSLQQTLFQNKTLTEELTDIRQKASNALLIEKERNELQSTLLVTQAELKEVSQRNEILSQSDRNVLFMLGAGTVFFGLLLGLLLPRLGARKRRNSWGNDSYLS